MTQSTNTLPHWDMTVVYPGLDSPEFEQGGNTITQDIGLLGDLFDTHGIAKREPGPLDEETVRTFETVTSRYNEVLDEAHVLIAYLYCLVSTDSRDDAAQARMSALENQSMRLSQLGTRFTAWLGALDIDSLIERSEIAREHGYALRRAKVEAEHLMSPDEEALAAELNLSDGTAWSKLHGNLTSQLSVPIDLNGEERDLPMSMIRNLALDPDRDTRRRAYEAEIAGWERVALPLAAALNSIKGEVNTLSQRRGWDTPLDEAVFENAIDRQTLEVMMEAARESFPDFRRYLRAKARALGLPALAWYDLLAPISKNARTWEFEEGASFIERQFSTYSTKMSEYAARAFRERWVDAEPRSGKRDGAYCIMLRGEESRIFANFKPAFTGVSTLAHELGHGYHNLNKARRTPIQRSTPMTLAETASIFCETIIQNAALKEASEAEQLALLETSLEGSCQVVVDITSRFLFETSVFEARRERELSVDELKGFMLDAQRETYGDGLDQEVLHPYMWAVKGHYYSAGRSYYNYPYMFGLLFGLGLYARYTQEPEGFKAGYDDLLSSTGLADAATLASRFGIDITTPEFWRSSLDVIRGQVDRFEELVRNIAG